MYLKSSIARDSTIQIILFYYEYIEAKCCLVFLDYVVLFS
jgi:hypothetical protein